MAQINFSTSRNGNWLAVDLDEQGQITFTSWFDSAPDPHPVHLVVTDKMRIYRPYDDERLTIWIHKDLLR